MRFVRTPLWLSSPLHEFMTDQIPRKWQDCGIQVLGNLCKDGPIGEYSDICNRYNLPCSHFLKFLQIRNCIKDLCKDYPRIADTPLGKNNTLI